MPTKPKAVYRFTAWSYSRLRDYLTCPLKTKLQHLMKIPIPPSPVLERGKAVHEAAERYAQGKITKMPAELQNFKEEFKALRKLGRVYTESQWAFDGDWKPCEWYAKETYCRMVVDLHFEIPGTTKLKIVDHKTGKIYEDAMEQLELFALGGFIMFPTVTEIECELWYLDQGEIKSKTFKRSEMETIRKKWEKMAKPILADTTFAPKPSNSCRWCPYSASKGGLCKF